MMKWMKAIVQGRNGRRTNVLSRASGDGLLINLGTMVRWDSVFKFAADDLWQGRNDGGKIRRLPWKP